MVLERRKGERKEFEKKSPFSQEELNVHFENNNKFLAVTRLERVIELLYSQK